MGSAHIKAANEMLVKSTPEETNPLVVKRNFKNTLLDVVSAHMKAARKHVGETNP